MKAVSATLKAILFAVLTVLPIVAFADSITAPSMSYTGTYTVYWNPPAGNSGDYMYAVFEYKNGTQIAIHTTGASKTFTNKPVGIYTYKLYFEAYEEGIPVAAGYVATATVGVSNSPSDDLDGDGVINSADLFPADPNDWADNDNDGFGDNSDTDDDNDGIEDENETETESGGIDG